MDLMDLCGGEIRNVLKQPAADVPKRQNADDGHRDFGGLSFGIFSPEH